MSVGARRLVFFVILSGCSRLIGSRAPVDAGTTASIRFGPTGIAGVF